MKQGVGSRLIGLRASIENENGDPWDQEPPHNLCLYISLKRYADFPLFDQSVQRAVRFHCADCRI